MSIVKISFEGTVKRAKLSVSNFAELKETVSKLFPQLNGSNEFFIQYIDEDNDLVTVSDDNDVSLMMSDPNIIKTKIIISKDIMSNSEINKQMISVPVSTSELKMEPVNQEKAPEIGVYPQLSQENETPSEEKIVEVKEVEKRPERKQSRGRSRSASKPKKEMNKKQKKLCKLAKKIIKKPEVRAKKGEKFMKILSSCKPEVLSKRPNKRLRILKAKAALDTILSESELDEIKKLEQMQKEKKENKPSKPNKTPKEPLTAEIKELKKKICKPEKYTPAEVEMAKKTIMAKLESEPTLLQDRKKYRAAILKIKSEFKKLTPEETTELETLQDKINQKKAEKQLRKARKSRSASRKGKVCKVSLNRRNISKDKTEKVKYPVVVKHLRNLLVNNKPLPPKSIERITEILAKDPQAFKNMPRLRVLALKAKKSNTGLTPEQEEELQNTQQILLVKPKSGPRSRSRSMSKGRLGDRSQSRGKIQRMESEIKRMKKMRREKREKVRGAQMNNQIDKRVEALLPGLAASIQSSMQNGEPVNTSIHRGFQCDCCKIKPIIGVRYSNRENNYDLCSVCAQKVKYEHPLEKIENVQKRQRKDIENGQFRNEGLRRRAMGRMARLAREAPKEAAPKEELPKKASPQKKRSISKGRQSSTEKIVKKVVQFGEEPKKAEQPKPVESSCPEWLKPKRDQLLSIFGTDPVKTESYLIANKFKPMEEIIDFLLINEAELAKLK